MQWKSIVCTYHYPSYRSICFSLLFSLNGVCTCTHTCNNEIILLTDYKVYFLISNVCTGLLSLSMFVCLCHYTLLRHSNNRSQTSEYHVYLLLYTSLPSLIYARLPIILQPLFFTFGKQLQ